MSLKTPLVIPDWQRVVGAIVAVALIYYLYREGSGGLAGTLITICLAIFIRSLIRSGAIPSNTSIPENSPLKARSIARDVAVVVSCWTVAMVLIIGGTIMVKNQVIPDNNLTATLVVGPP